MQYYYSNDGTNQQGPADLDGLRQAGITRQTLVWRDGMPGWTPAGDVQELAELFADANPAIELSYTSKPNTVEPQVPDGPLSYQGQYPNQVQTANGMAIASMVLGIVGILSVFCYCFGLIPSILAIIFGHIAKGQIRRGQGSGDGMALAGLILGYITVVFTVVALIFFFAVGIYSSATTPRFTPAPAPVVVPAQPIPTPPQIPPRPTFPRP